MTDEKQRFCSFAVEVSRFFLKIPYKETACDGLVQKDYLRDVLELVRGLSSTPTLMRPWVNLTLPSLHRNHRSTHGMVASQTDGQNWI